MEVIHNDYDYATHPGAEVSEANSPTRNNISVSKLVLSNIFDQGKVKLVEMKISLVRERKKIE